MGKTLYDGKRPKGYLATELNDICKKVVSGEVTMKEGVYLTPYNAAKLFGEIEGVEKDDLPSHGAIKVIFERWERIGYASFRKVPYAFVDFTEEGRQVGLDELMARDKASKKALTANERADKLEAEAKALRQQAQAAAASLAAETD